MRKQLFVVLFLSVQSFVFAQSNYEFTRKATPEEKKNFLGIIPEVFLLKTTFTIGISTSDVEMNFKDMQHQEQYPASFLEAKLKALKSDSLNPLLLNDIAMYYERALDETNARKYFDKSMKNLGYLMKKAKDSAKYYSFRGLLKLHLNQDGSMADLEKSLQINENDSLASVFYPLILINQGKIADARKFSIKLLDGNPKKPESYYVLLYLTYIMEIMPNMEDDSKLKENRKKEYDAFFDHALLNKYAEKYKDRIQIKNARNMLDVANLLLKATTFKVNEDYSGIIMDFTEREKKRIVALQDFMIQGLKKGTVNEFSAYKYLGVLYCFQNNAAKSIEYAQKALTVVPLDKQFPNFSNDEVYDLLLTMYHYQKNFTELKKTLEEKMVKGFSKSSLADDHAKMAITYLLENNFEKAEEWSRKGKTINSENFECLRLLSLFYAFKENSPLCKYYGESASKYMPSKEDAARLSLQFAGMMIISDDPTLAQLTFENIDNAKKIYDGDCKVCDELMAKYLKVKP